MADSISRSIAKSLTWRITATLTTILIAYFIIGDVNTAMMIGGIEFFAKMIIYFLHERLWASVPKIKWK
jgi:uncharacterized membrane protein